MHKAPLCKNETDLLKHDEEKVEKDYFESKI
jgi:hypothetical protein